MPEMGFFGVNPADRLAVEAIATEHPDLLAAFRAWLAVDEVFPMCAPALAPADRRRIPASLRVCWRIALGAIGAAQASIKAESESTETEMSESARTMQSSGLTASHGVMLAATCLLLMGCTGRVFMTAGKLRPVDSSPALSVIPRPKGALRVSPDRLSVRGFVEGRDYLVIPLSPILQSVTHEVALFEEFSITAGSWNRADAGPIPEADRTVDLRLCATHVSENPGRSGRGAQLTSVFASVLTLGLVPAVTTTDLVLEAKVTDQHGTVLGEYRFEETVLEVFQTLFIFVPVEVYLSLEGATVQVLENMFRTLYRQMQADGLASVSRD